MVLIHEYLAIRSSIHNYEETRYQLPLSWVERFGLRSMIKIALCKNLQWTDVEPQNAYFQRILKASRCHLWQKASSYTEAGDSLPISENWSATRP